MRAILQAGWNSVKTIHIHIDRFQSLATSSVCMKSWLELRGRLARTLDSEWSEWRAFSIDLSCCYREESLDKIQLVRACSKAVLAESFSSNTHHDGLLLTI